MYICMCIFMYGEQGFYFKELALTVIEAGKSQDLQSELASWGTKRASGLVPAWVWRSEAGRANSVVPLKVDRLESQEKLIFQFKSEGTKKTSVSVWRQLDRKNPLYLGEGQPFCSVQAFDWMKDCLPQIKFTNTSSIAIVTILSLSVHVYRFALEQMSYYWVVCVF